MSVHDVVGQAPDYYEINREERNYAAIFFAQLLKPGNAERFLKICGITETPGEGFGVYFEYAYLRDLWNTIADEEVKKELIKKHLRISRIEEILSKDPESINRYFGVVGKASTKHIQYPGRWSVKNFTPNFSDNREDLRKVCRFKWAFNIKPDIVIHLAKDSAVCIEAKYESGEGSYSYPGNGADSKERKESKERITQLELQKYMMEELLGIKTTFVYLAREKAKNTSKADRLISWGEAFGSLDAAGLPPFVARTIEKISNPQT